jgi:hypothetical protein
VSVVASPAHELYGVVWLAARDIAAGGDGLASATPARLSLAIDVEPDLLGELAAASVAEGLACRPEAMGPRWPEFEPKLRKMIEAIFPGRARNRLRALALGVAKARANSGRAGDDDVLTLGDRTAPRALADARQLTILQLRTNEATLAAAALPLLGPLTGSDLVDAILQQVSRTPLAAAVKARRPWRRPVFWVAAGRALLALHGLGLRRLTHDPAMLRQVARHRARHAVAVGLQAVLRADLKPLVRQGGPSEHGEAVARLAWEARQLHPPAAPGRHGSTEARSGRNGPIHGTHSSRMSTPGTTPAATTSS